MENKSTTPKIVVIGGGTGSFTLLSTLKHYTSNITAVVNMVDDGGSTGKLRDELGTLPTGDVRQCLVALSDAEDDLRELFNYRFTEGGLSGHSFGNIFLSALEKTKSSFDESVRLASNILNIKGSVAPVTLTDVELQIELDGKTYSGQENIEGLDFHGSKRPKLMLSPTAQINPKAKEAILAADLVVIAPGNLYSSLLPNLIVDGVREAIEQTEAKLVVVANLVNKKSQTVDLNVEDYLDIFSDYLGQGSIDYAIYNNGQAPEGLLEKYANLGEKPIDFDVNAINDRVQIKSYADSLISDKPVERPAGSDGLIEVPRNYIRHDSDKVSRLLMKIYYS